MFSCSQQGFFDVVQLGCSVRDEAGLGPTPRVTQLLALLDEHERFLVALVDRRRLRLLRVELGEVDELPGVVDPEARAVDTSVELGSFEHHSEEAARVHYRRAADHVARALAEWPAERLIVGGPDESVAAVEEYLPRPARDKVVGRVSVGVSAAPVDIAAAALEIEEAIERRREAETVEQLRQRVASGRGGVVGLEATLAALSERRVGTLLVSEGFVATGTTCPACGHLGVDVRQCPVCGTTNIEIDDIVEVAVEAAVGQKATVEFCRDSELDRFGRIGAIERY
jgi:peptide subunit release factor 1 (eRF1)